MDIPCILKNILLIAKPIRNIPCRKVVLTTISLNLTVVYTMSFHIYNCIYIYYYYIRYIHSRDLTISGKYRNCHKDDLYDCTIKYKMSQYILDFLQSLITNDDKQNIKTSWSTQKKNDSLQYLIYTDWILKLWLDSELFVFYDTKQYYTSHKHY